MNTTEPAHNHSPSPGPEPAAPRPRVWTVFVGFIATFVVTSIVSSIVVGALFFVHWAGLPDKHTAPDDLLKDFMQFVTSSTGLLGGAAASSLSLISASYIGARLGRTDVSKRLRTGTSGFGWGRTAIAAIGALALGQVCGCFISLLGLSQQGALKMFADALLKMGPGLLVLAVFFIGITAPIGEEVFFRGFIQTRLSQRWRPALAISVTALLFGFLHLDPIQGTFAFILGLYLGWITEKSASVRPAIAAHALNNCSSVIAGRFLPTETSFTIDIAMLAGAAVIFAAVMVFLKFYPRAKPMPVAEH